MICTNVCGGERSNCKPHYAFISGSLFSDPIFWPTQQKWIFKATFILEFASRIITRRAAFRVVVVPSHHWQCCHCFVIDHLLANTILVRATLRLGNSIVRQSLMVRPAIDLEHVQMVQLLNTFKVNEKLIGSILSRFYKCVQWTLSDTRFDTAGGTSFEAIHK